MFTVYVVAITIAIINSFGMTSVNACCSIRGGDIPRYHSPTADSAHTRNVGLEYGVECRAADPMT